MTWLLKSQAACCLSHKWLLMLWGRMRSPLTMCCRGGLLLVRLLLYRWINYQFFFRNLYFFIFGYRLTSCCCLFIVSSRFKDAVALPGWPAVLIWKWSMPWRESGCLHTASVVEARTHQLSWPSGISAGSNGRGCWSVWRKWRAASCVFMTWGCHGWSKLWLYQAGWDDILFFDLAVCSTYSM